MLQQYFREFLMGPTDGCLRYLAGRNLWNFVHNVSIYMYVYSWVFLKHCIISWFFFISFICSTIFNAFSIITDMFLISKLFEFTEIGFQNCVNKIFGNMLHVFDFFFFNSYILISSCTHMFARLSYEKKLNLLLPHPKKKRYKSNKIKY